MSISRKQSGVSLSLVVAAVLLLSAGARAQAPYLAKGNQEANVFAGLSYGLDHWRGSFGGNYAVAPFKKWLMFYGEYSYFPGIARTIGEIRSQDGTTLVSPGGTTSFRVHDIHGGVHIRMPIFPEKRIVPYAAFGVGGVITDQNGTLPVRQGTNTFIQQNLNLTASGFAANAGGGFRLYLSGSGRLGMRLEAKAYFPKVSISNYSVNSSGSDRFGKISLGIFYQFK